MRRLAALFLFTAGYMLMAMLDTSVSAVPAFATFATGAALLVRPAPEREDDVARIARELARQ